MYFPHCTKYSSASILEPFIITPTFLKVFDNTHIQMTWHNAFIELAQATEVVFIGYSLPLADYHFRTLLKRAVHQDVAITVVLTNRDRMPVKVKSAHRNYYASYRFSEFFSSNPVKFRYGGIKSFYSEEMDRWSYKGTLGYLKRSLE